MFELQVARNNSPDWSFRATQRIRKREPGTEALNTRKPRMGLGSGSHVYGQRRDNDLTLRFNFYNSSVVLTDRELTAPSRSTIAMNSEEIFNWPDGDVILRATHGTENRDFRVHKLFLSFSSPVFKDMFKIPQPSSVAPDGIDVVDVTDPPRALELVLRCIYPFPASPVVDDLTTLSEALVLVDKYNIEAARSRLRPSFKELAATEPLRAYAIACRFGLEDEMKIASSHTTLIHLSGLTELPEEFKLIPATEYHRLILLHSRFRKEAATIATRTPLAQPTNSGFFGAPPPMTAEDMGRREGMRKHIKGYIEEGIPLGAGSLTRIMKADGGFSDREIQPYISSVLSQIDALYMTI